MIQTKLKDNALANMVQRMFAGFKDFHTEHVQTIIALIKKKKLPTPGKRNKATDPPWCDIPVRMLPRNMSPCSELVMWSCNLMVVL